MIIRQLELKNFLSHDHSQVNFDKGVTVIYGHNGAGKSSLIDAVKFALFGEKRGSQIADLIRRGASDMEVDLDFEIGPDQYRISRIMGLGKSGINKRDATLTKNKSVLSTTVKSVDATVGGILGIDREAFMNSVFVEQGEIDTLISKTASDRERTFSRILGLDLLGKYADDLGKLSRETDARLQSFSNVAENIEELENSITEKEELIKEVKEGISAVSAERKNISEKLSEIEKGRAELQSSISDLKSVAGTVENRKQTLNQVQERARQRSDDITNLEKKLDELSKGIDQELMNKSEDITEYFSFSESLSSRKEILADLEERIGELEKMAEEIKGLEQGYRSYSDLDRKLNELRRKRSEIEEKGAKFSAAEKRIQEIRQETEKKKANLEFVSSRLREIFGLQEFSRDSVIELKSSLESDRAQVNDKIQEIRALVGRYNNELKEVSEKRSKLPSSDKCPLCLQDLSEDHRRRIDQDYTAKEEAIRKSLSDLAAAKGKLDGKFSGIAEKLSELNTNEVNQALVDLQYTGDLMKEMSALEGSLPDLKKDHDTLVSFNEEFTQTEANMALHRKAYDQYKSFELTLSSSNLDELRKRLADTRAETGNAEKRLSELETRIGFRPDPESRAKIREMREREKGMLKVKEDLLSMKTAQGSDTDKTEELRKEIAVLEQKLSGYSELEGRFREISGVYDETNRKLQDLISRESSLKTSMESEERNIAQLRENLEKLKNELQTMEKIRKSIGTINKLRSCFDRDGIQKAIRKDSAVYITNRVREYSSSFNLDFDDVSINEDMSIVVSQNGNIESIDMLSGGEKVALAIALRLSLATYVLESIRTIVMDEPTTYLDEDRRSNLKDIIQYTFRGDETPVPQMVIVTHHKELGSVADNVFEISKKGGKSLVSEG